MLSSSFPRILAFSLISHSASACGTPPAKEAAAAAEASAEKSESSKKVDDSRDPQAPADAAAQGAAIVSEAPAPILPAWWGPGLIAHDEMVRNDVSMPREDGSVAAAMNMILAEGVDVAGCIEAFRKAMKGKAEFAEVDTGPDGRQTLKGKADEGPVTVVCGEAAGRTRGYIALELGGSR